MLNISENPTLVVMDEFGDGIDVNTESIEGRWRRVLDLKQQSFLVPVFNSLEVEYLVISLHPVLLDSITGKIVDGLFKENTFEVQSLNIVMRNTQRIFRNCEEFGINMAGIKPMSVVGTKPVLIKGDPTTPTYYREALKAMENVKKFLVLQMSVKFNLKLFTEEARRRNIQIFPYLQKEDKENLESYLKAGSGCLLTKYKYVKGTESTAVLIFEDSLNNASIFSLRASSHLVTCLPESTVNVRVQGPGILRIQGFREEAAPYRKLQEILKKRKYKKIVFLHDDDFLQEEVEWFKESLESIPLEPGYPGSQEVLDIHLSSQEGCILYSGWSVEREAQLYSWLEGKSIPLVVSVCLPNCLYIYFFDPRPNPGLKKTWACNIV